MDTLLHTHEGVSPMHEIVEAQTEAHSILDDEKFLRWEALRDRVNTIGARNAVDEAVLVHERRKAAGGHVLFDYLWFIIVCAALLFFVAQVGGCDDQRDPGAGSHIPAEVKGDHHVR